MVCVGRDLGADPVPVPCHGRGHLPLDQVTQGWLCSIFALNPSLQADVLGPAGMSAWFGVLPAEENPCAAS